MCGVHDQRCCSQNRNGPGLCGEGEGGSLATQTLDEVEERPGRMQVCENRELIELNDVSVGHQFADVKTQEVILV